MRKAPVGASRLESYRLQSSYSQFAVRDEQHDGNGDSLYHHPRRTTKPRRNPGWNPYTRPNPRRTTNPRRNPGWNPRWTTNPRPRQNILSMLSPWPTDCATPREPPPGRAAAVRVEPAVAIVRAAKPIATLRMMMSIVLSTPAFQNQTRQFLTGCSRAAQSRGVSRNQKGRTVPALSGTGF